MNFKRAEINTIKGKESKESSFGIILILFILLVIVTTFVYSSTQGDKLPGDDLTTIQATRRFDIYNRTLNFSLVSTSLEGQFDSPFPPTHIILPNQSYNFEVRTFTFTRSSASVTYNVISGIETVGNIRINMRVQGGASPPIQTTIINFINGPIRYENGGNYVNIFDS
ncbi:hypothetical protein SAMN05444162_4967 [Paenibacillaceae bacterium GAS479]|nr:hypothetical protein SAMN05444162_4967 [Paenibacillaceae bacterium GAS479]